MRKIFFGFNRIPFLWKINLLLFLMIFVFIFLKFYRPTVYIDCGYNSKPGKLLELIDVNSGNSLWCVFVFNDYPLLNQLEVVEKIRLRYSDKINIYSFFSKKFRVNQRIDFSHSFIKRKIICKNKPDLKNFFILFREKLLYFSPILKLDEMLFLIEKNLNPDFQYSNLLLNPEIIKNKVSSRLKEGGVKLLNIVSNKEEMIEKIEGKVILIHGECLPCQLDKIFEKINKEKSENHIFIFSFWANLSELIKRFSTIKTSSSFYVDYNDELDLAISIPQKEFILEIDFKEEGK